MTRQDGKRRAVEQLKRAIQQAARARDTRADAINTVSDANVVVANNAGSSESKHSASATQVTRIVQSDGKTRTETIIARRSEGGDSGE